MRTPIRTPKQERGHEFRSGYERFAAVLKKKGIQPESVVPPQAVTNYKFCDPAF